MDAAREFIGEKVVDKTVAVDAAFGGKRWALNYDLKVSFVARGPMTMSGVFVRLVYDLQSGRRESGFQFAFNQSFDGAFTWLSHLPLLQFSSIGSTFLTWLDVSDLARRFLLGGAPPFAHNDR